MKRFYLAMAMLLAGLSSKAQLFDFANTPYFTASDTTPQSGTVLSASSNTLYNFTYNDQPWDHPIYSNGVYFPVNDCAGHNLWLRVKHVASDPNGVDNGFNVPQTLNSPFLPFGSNDRIGGWYGFLYDFQVFSDANLSGTRANEIAGAYPIQIIVESLETLYNDGGTQFEWLSFEILNEESDGWRLMATNFTGINPQSNPGFSADLHYSTPVDFGQAPDGFSVEFPEGSKTVYAVDLNLSASYHSEFRMTANAVSHFRYGYEFTSGGYQGMSMTFGGAPTILSSVTPQCGTEPNGSISLSTTGPQPFVFDWGGGITGNTISNLGVGDYSVTLTDGSGCTASQTFTITEEIPVYVSLDVQTDENGAWLIASPDGGNGDYSFSWNTGESTDSIYVTESGNYQVTVRSMNGCSATAEFQFVGFEQPEQTRVKLFPNPATSLFTLETSKASNFRILSLDGRQLYAGKTDASGQTVFNTQWLSSGVYLVEVKNQFGPTGNVRLVIAKP